jgi:hypothetical protein
VNEPSTSILSEADVYQFNGWFGLSDSAEETVRGLARSEVTERPDPFLSPIVPTIEDGSAS